jgi:hypothetical protein
MQNLEELSSKILSMREEFECHDIVLDRKNPETFIKRTFAGFGELSVNERFAYLKKKLEEVDAIRDKFHKEQSLYMKYLYTVLHNLQKVEKEYIETTNRYIDLLWKMRFPSQFTDGLEGKENLKLFCEKMRSFVMDGMTKEENEERLKFSLLPPLDGSEDWKKLQILKEKYPQVVI